MSAETSYSQIEQRTKPPSPSLVQNASNIRRSSDVAVSPGTSRAHDPPVSSVSRRALAAWDVYNFPGGPALLPETTISRWGLCADDTSLSATGTETELSRLRRNGLGIEEALFELR